MVTLAKSNLDPYEELANAIIIQAVTDYRESRITLKTCSKDKDAMKMIRDVPNCGQTKKSAIKSIDIKMEKTQMNTDDFM